jgi:hypothetical protein
MSSKKQKWVLCGVGLASGKLILENFRQCTKPYMEIPSIINNLYGLEER